MMEIQDSEYKCTLDGDAVAKAKKELGENPDTRLLEVKNLRKRVAKIPGLKPRTDINFLLRFLRVRKFNQEKAFKSVKTFYEWKKKHSDIFDDLKPSNVKHMLDAGYIEILKQRNNEGCRVMILRIANWDEERYSVVEPVKLYAACLLKMQEEEENQVHGIHMVVDLGRTTWKQAIKWTPSVAKLCVEMPQAMVPLRLKRIDYVHQPGFFNQIFPIFKQFMKEKLVQRLHFDNDQYQSLQASLDPEFLPSDYGGKLEPFSNTEWTEAFLNSDAEFEENNKLGFLSMDLESEKKEKREEDAGLHGLGGTFKKIEL